MSWWRKTLRSCKLSPTWLSQYSSIVDPLSSRPSHSHPKPTTEPIAGASNDDSALTGGGPPLPAPQQASEPVDASLEDDPEIDDKDDYVIDEVEEFDFEE